MLRSGSFGGLYPVAHAAGTPTVSVADLAKAGFTGAVVQQPGGGGYLPPNYYFKVKETVASTHPEWGGAADLVAVLIFPMPYDPGFSLPEPSLKDFSGRTQACVTGSGNYICVTGPLKDKVVALAGIIAAK